MRTLRTAPLRHAVLAAVLLVAAVTTASAQSALRLGPGNTDTYVAFDDAAKLRLSSFTLETWFMRQGPGVAASTGSGGIASFVPLLTKGAGAGGGTAADANWLLGIDAATGVLAADFQEGAAGTSPGANHPVLGTTPIVNDVWYHAAATYDGTTWRLYLNGVLEAELVVGEPVRADGTLPAALGTMLAADASPSGFFDGTLDEARVWSVARSAADVRATVNVQNPFDGTLVARWALDDGVGTMVDDAVELAQDGSVTGAAYEWVASAPFDVVLCDVGGTTCDDGLFCNGADACDATLRCTTHDGDPCSGGAECNDTCNETTDDCFVAAGTSCTDDGNVCTDDACDGAGACAATPNTAPCDDGLFCNGSDTCGGGTCGHTGDPCAGGDACNDACNEATDDCFAPAGTSCAGDGNVCTDDACDGAGTCAATPNAASCDDGLFCNGADVCSGGSCGHAGDPCLGGGECSDACNEATNDCFDLAGTACDDDGNVCTSDRCDGGGTCAHPAGNAGATCRAVAGTCDVAETCDGTSTSCPADVVRTAGTSCRPVAGVCDVAESCDGTSALCPADAFVAAGTECRPSAGQCDVAEACTGAAAACPANGFVADGTSCDDGEACSGDDACAAGACVGTLDATVCLDHFTCYAASATPGTERFRAVYGLPLEDAFGTTIADVRKSKLLCASASKDGRDPAAAASSDTLETYVTSVDEKFTKVESLHVTNQLGETLVDVVKPSGFALPSATSRVAIPPPLASPAFDEFQCYRVRPARGAPRFVPATGVVLADQFGSFTVGVRKLKRLCAPANRHGANPDAPSHRAYLACYQVKQTSAPKFAKITPLYLANPFGGETLDVKAPSELCVPSIVD
ncbi:hypothetical protein K2Z84_06320 [Candidatus Binatia bacterium]|nr:hypothetical protein [Candidatus Binatia bacterium]